MVQTSAPHVHSPHDTVVQTSVPHVIHLMTRWCKRQHHTSIHLMTLWCKRQHHKSIHLMSPWCKRQHHTSIHFMTRWQGTDTDYRRSLRCKTQLAKNCITMECHGTFSSNGRENGQKQRTLTQRTSPLEPANDAASWGQTNAMCSNCSRTRKNTAAGL